LKLHRAADGGERDRKTAMVASARSSLRINAHAACSFGSSCCGSSSTITARDWVTIAST
jgi:hypothetical protein